MFIRMQIQIPPPPPFCSQLALTFLANSAASRPHHLLTVCPVSCHLSNTYPIPKFLQPLIDFSN